MIGNITWFGHDAFKIVGGKVVYIDPFQLPAMQEPADVILITHEHFDHCSPKDIRLIRQPSTIVIASTMCDPDHLGGNATLVRPGDHQTVGDLIVEAVPAYNLNKEFHPQADPRVGFVVTVEGRRIYHAGDTDFIPEMRNLQDIDVALVPVSGTYVMTAEEAAEAVSAFHPKTAIPMHYGSIIGNAGDAERFKRLSKVPVEILEQT